MTDKEYFNHLNSCYVFWKEKGTPERYVNWESFKPELKTRNPEILHAWESLNNINTHLDLAFKFQFDRMPFERW